MSIKSLQGHRVHCPLYSTLSTAPGRELIQLDVAALAERLFSIFTELLSFCRM